MRERTDTGDQRVASADDRSEGGRGMSEEVDILDIVRLRLLTSRGELQTANAWMREAQALLETLEYREATAGRTAAVAHIRSVLDRCPLPKEDDNGAA